MKVCKVILLVIAVIIVIIATPVLVYNGLKLPIEYSIIGINNDTSGWLGFWGSFLGGIFGGLATLIGVRLSIKKSDSEKKSERRPVIIPKTKHLNMSCLEEIKENFNLLNSNDKEEVEDLIYMDLLNGSRETAVEITIGWNKPTNSKIKMCKDLSIAEQKAFDGIIEKLGIETSTTTTLDMLATLQENQLIIPYMYQIYLEEVIRRIMMINKSNELVVRREVPFGNLLISYANIYKEKVTAVYEVTGFIHSNTIHKNNVYKKNGYVTLNFKLINN